MAAIVLSHTRSILSHSCSTFTSLRFRIAPITRQHMSRFAFMCIFMSLQLKRHCTNNTSLASGCRFKLSIPSIESILTTKASNFHGRHVRILIVNVTPTLANNGLYYLALDCGYSNRFIHVSSY